MDWLCYSADGGGESEVLPYNRHGVIPTEAGIQQKMRHCRALDSRLREGFAKVDGVLDLIRVCFP
jgi:hypothetical protein